MLHRNFRLYRNGIFQFFDLRGPMLMIQQTRHSIKPDGTEKLFVVKVTVRFFECGVALVRNGSECMIDRHVFQVLSGRS